MAPSVGSLLDLFPRVNTAEWVALPVHVKEEIKLLRKGYRPVSQGDLDEHNLLPKRIEHLQHEVKGLASKLEDVRTGLSELGEKLISPVEHLLAELRALASRVSLHGEDIKKLVGRADANDIKHHMHDAKHREHTDRIKAVAKRLDVVEKLVTTRKPRGKKTI